MKYRYLIYTSGETISITAEGCDVPGNDLVYFYDTINDEKHVVAAFNMNNILGYRCMRD